MAVHNCLPHYAERRQSPGQPMQAFPVCSDRIPNAHQQLWLHTRQHDWWRSSYREKQQSHSMRHGTQTIESYATWRGRSTYSCLPFKHLLSERPLKPLRDDSEATEAPPLCREVSLSDSKCWNDGQNWFIGTTVETVPHICRDSYPHWRTIHVSHFACN